MLFQVFNTNYNFWYLKASLLVSNLTSPNVYLWFSHIVFPYSVYGQSIQSAGSLVKDFSFIHTRILYPNKLSETICYKTLKMLSFIQDISCQSYLVTLQGSLLCTHALYTWIWCCSLELISLSTQWCALRKDQCKFFYHSFFTFKIVYLPHDYSPVSELRLFSNLSDRRHRVKPIIFKSHFWWYWLSDLLSFVNFKINLCYQIHNYFLSS